MLPIKNEPASFTYEDIMKKIDAVIFPLNIFAGKGLVSVFDKDHSEKIDAPTEEQAAVDYFRKFDANGDGVIQASEMRKGLDSLRNSKDAPK